MDMGFMLLPALLTLIIGGAAGCQSNSPEYSVGFYNDNSALISGCRVDWAVDGEKRHELLGDVGAGGPAVTHSVLRPIPRTAKVTWETPDGKVHDSQVDVATCMPDPAHFSGTVFFKVMADGTVRVVPLTYDEIRRLSYEQKSYP